MWQHHEDISANLCVHLKTMWTSRVQGSNVFKSELKTISLYSSYFELHHALQACFCSSYSMLTKQACLLNCTIPCRLHALQLACVSYYSMLTKQACLLNWTMPCCLLVLAASLYFILFYDTENILKQGTSHCKLSYSVFFKVYRSNK